MARIEGAQMTDKIPEHLKVRTDPEADKQTARLMAKRLQGIKTEFFVELPILKELNI